MPERPHNKTYSKCPDCDGIGYTHITSSSPPPECRACAGTGYVYNPPTESTPQPPLQGVDPKGDVGKTKVQLHLVPPIAMEHCANSLAQGIHPSKNYGPFNWRQNQYFLTTYISAMKRHIAAFEDGEHIDPHSPTGSTHLGAIMANCAIILDAHKWGTLVDDRVIPGKEPGL